MNVNHSPAFCDYYVGADLVQAAERDDRVLLDQVAAGDEAALAALWARHGRKLYTYLVHMVGDPAVAEELLQEVWIAAWQGAGRFRGRAEVRTWLYRIAHYRAVSWLRRARALLVSLDASPELPADDDPPADAQAHWRQALVRRALDCLSPKHRAVLELTFYHGFSYQEIAAIVGCPVGTVKSRMNHARRCLQAALKELGFEEELT
jgi:RNA polymerase sigma-70 factor (ECF subfamily)